MYSVQFSHTSTMYKCIYLSIYISFHSLIHWFIYPIDFVLRHLLLCGSKYKNFTTYNVQQSVFELSNNNPYLVCDIFGHSTLNMLAACCVQHRQQADSFTAIRRCGVPLKINNAFQLRNTHHLMILSSTPKGLNGSLLRQAPGSKVTTWTIGHIYVGKLTCIPAWNGMRLRVRIKQHTSL